MAEAAAIIGILAAAAQFGDIGCKIILHTSRLVSKVRDCPECLQVILNQIRLLLYLAELTKKKVMEECSLPQSSTRLAPIMPLTWLESVWQDCTTQACEIDRLVSAILQEVETDTIRKTWRKIWSLKSEEKIERILTVIERYKSLLSIWFGQECLAQLHTLSKSVHELQGDVENACRSIAQFDHALQRLAPAEASESTTLAVNSLRNEYYKTTKSYEQRLLGFIGDQSRNSLETRKQLQLLTTELYGLRSEFQSMSSGGSQMVRKKSPHNRCGELGSQGTTRVLEPTRKSAFTPLFSECKCGTDHLQRVYKLGGTVKMMVGFCHSRSGNCPIHHGRKPTSKTTVHYRQKLPYITKLLNITLFIDQKLGNPSLGFSLRTEARVRVLHLHSFFRKLYDCHLHPKEGFKKHTSLERQDYLFSIARRMLLDAFRLGKASPDDVDSQGRTYLHLQVDFHHWGDEPFLARMILLLLSMGVRADVLNDDFCTAQQTLAWRLTYRKRNDQLVTQAASPIGNKLLDWTGCESSSFIGVSGILDCIDRWPESISDWGYPEICDIVLRRSIDDIKRYACRTSALQEQTSRQLSPLHFAAAADWPEGVRALLACGADKYAEDSQGLCPLDVAISTQSTSIVKIFLKSDLRPYILQKTRYQGISLRQSFLLAAGSNNEELQSIIIDALVRQQYHFHGLRPYHDLANLSNDQGNMFAEKLYSAGFRLLEEYDEQGMTPLMNACRWGNMGLVAFLLSHGANPCQKHRDAHLRSGHFLTYTPRDIWWYMEWGFRSGDSLDRDDEAELLEASFLISGRVESKCRCSPDGYSPLTAMLRRASSESSYSRIRGFESMMRYLSPQRLDITSQWRCLVVLEVFDRLELTHTCIKPLPKVQTFSEVDRLEIEDEEGELFSELESLMNEYDEWQERFTGDIAYCVKTFFDNIDVSLKPLQSTLFGTILWNDEDADILGPGLRFENSWISSRGRKVTFGHDEGVGECHLLGSIFE